MPKRISAADIMTKKLLVLKPEMNVMEAVKILLKNRISGAPVVDDGGALIGIVSELDCINHVTHQAMEGLPTMEVQSIMTGEVATVSPDAKLTTLTDLFTTKRYRRLPVVDENGVLKGQVSRRDVLRALDDLMGAKFREDPGPLYLSAVLDQAPAVVRGTSNSPRDRIG